MKKQDFIKATMEKTGEPKITVEKIYNAIFEVIREALLNGDKVTLPSVGTLTVKDSKARKGHNPKTGESIDIPAKKSAKFKMNATLKETLN